MQQVAQRPVDVEGGDEALGVGARDGDQFRETLLEARRKDEEEERKVGFGDRRFGSGKVRPNSVIGNEKQNGIVQIAFHFHSFQ